MKSRKKEIPRPPQSAPQHRHIRSDSWRNAFYHAPLADPIDPTHLEPSMADVADLAVSLEGIDVAELGGTPPRPTLSSRRRRRMQELQQHQQQPKAPSIDVPPRSPTSSTMPSRNRRLATEHMTVDHRSSDNLNSAHDEYPTQQQRQQFRDASCVLLDLSPPLHLDSTTGDPTQTQQLFHHQPSNYYTNYGSLHPLQEASTVHGPPPSSHAYNDMTIEQSQDVQAFSAMANNDRGYAADINNHPHHPHQHSQYPSSFVSETAHDAGWTDSEGEQDEKPFTPWAPWTSEPEQLPEDSITDSSLPEFVETAPAKSSPSTATTTVACCGCWVDVKGWLLRDAKVGADGYFYFDKWADWSLPGFVRHYLYNPLQPEFTSLQQFDWAIIIGIVMGLYTAAWKYLIDSAVEFVWVKVPTFLLRVGCFTDLDGSFPLYHYMWITPAGFAGVLSYLLYALPKLPDQNDWITNLHSRGVQDYTHFWPLLLISTASMASGLSLGPEFPLVITAGMFGSWLGTVCQQSMLQARILNLTAAGAAVGGFFGFPMAGALFVMEIPHRMGLQYFEALSPATISSIVAVLCNRILTQNDVTGYYKYPFLSMTLPSEIFTSAILYGLYGALIGTIYVALVKWCKGGVHGLLHSWTRPNPSIARATSEVELNPLLLRRRQSTKGTKRGLLLSKRRGLYVAMTGAFAGAVVGWIGVFLPHVMFWGEAQLQSLIDEGRTPLPIFGLADEPTAGLTARGFCLIDSNDERAIRNGFNLQCTFAIGLAKIVVTGISLKIGIGGQFWGPLFVGCAAGHFLLHLVRLLAHTYQFSSDLAAHPCVVILCTMGATHVVTFRAHMAIMLILTLTISTFGSESDPNVSTAGDYSAVFPLLVVAVFVSLMTTRSTIFYFSQRSRGDITAVPEVLCEPGMEGRPLVFEYEGDSDDSSIENTTDDEEPSTKHDDSTFHQRTRRNPHATRTGHELKGGLPNPEPPAAAVSANMNELQKDEVLTMHVESTTIVAETHCPEGKSYPETNMVAMSTESTTVSRARSNSTSSTRGALVRISCYGELQDHQPSLTDQARKRAASVDRSDNHRRVESQTSHPGQSIQRTTGRHRRKDSETSVGSFSSSPIPSIRPPKRNLHSTSGMESRQNLPNEAVECPPVATALNAEVIDDVFNTQVELMTDGIDLIRHS